MRFSCNTPLPAKQSRHPFVSAGTTAGILLAALTASMACAADQVMASEVMPAGSMSFGPQDQAQFFPVEIPEAQGPLFQGNASWSSHDAALALPRGRARAILSAKITFCPNKRKPCGQNLGYAVMLGMSDAQGNEVVMGIRSAYLDGPSLGVPKPFAQYHATSMSGVAQVYGQTALQPGRAYNVSVQYFDDVQKAFLLINNKVELEIPIQLIDRITFSPRVEAGGNGDYVSAQFNNVTLDGSVPGGNGAQNNQVTPNGTWNVETYSNFNNQGLSFRQQGSPNKAQGASFSAEGTARGLPEDPHWHAAQSRTMIAEYWFGS